MKPSGLLLAASVVGAVAIGGAVTGSTHATWRDSAVLAPATITAGFLSVTMSGPSGPLAELEANSSITLRVPVDTAGAGANLLSKTSIRTAEPVPPISLAVAVVSHDAPCDTAVPEPWDGGRRPLTEDPVSPGAAAICLQVARADGDVPGHQVDLALEAFTQQYRGATPIGWSDSDQVTLSLRAPAREPGAPGGAPKQPTFTCAKVTDGFRLAWSSENATGFRLYYLENSGSRQPVFPANDTNAPTTETSLIVGTPTKDSKMTYLLVAINAAGQAEASVKLEKGTQNEWRCTQ